MKTNNEDPNNGQQTTRNFTLFGINSSNRSLIGGCTAVGVITTAAFTYGRMNPKNQERTRKGACVVLGCFAAGCLIYKLTDSLKHYFDCRSEAGKKASIIEAEANAYQKRSEADVTAFIMKRTAIRDIKVDREQATISPIDENQNIADYYRDDYQDWLDGFRQSHEFPKVLPNILRQIIAGCPDGFKEPMILHLLASLGALCFSRVRAIYLDNQKHSPTLHVVVEGVSGSGKQKFDQVRKAVFKPIIERDKEKLALIDRCRYEGKEAHYIIQIAGINMSFPKLIDILADNQGVHFDMFETEINVVSDALRKSNGIGYELLRKAFSGEDVYKNNKSANGSNGIFTANFSYTFTGTPDDVARFIKNEIQGGTANRIGWSGIPRNGAEISKLELPSDKELEAMQKQIDEWRQKYCYTSENGKDVACPESEIDLQYVSEAIEQWLNNQQKMADDELCATRRDNRQRIGTIAFHCGIVLHMLFGTPSARQPEVRKNVLALVIYLANYCMERYLYKFDGSPKSPTPNVPIRSEFVHKETEPNKVIPAEETIQGFPMSIARQMVDDYIPHKFGYNSVLKKYGYPDDEAYRSRMRRTVEQLSTKQVEV